MNSRSIDLALAEFEDALSSRCIPVIPVSQVRGSYRVHLVIPACFVPPAREVIEESGPLPDFIEIVEPENLKDAGLALVLPVAFEDSDEGWEPSASDYREVRS